MASRHWKLAVLWAISLAVVSVATTWAQGVPRPSTPRTVPPLILTAPNFVSGNDIGFRLERTVDGIPVGKFVVRINGVWMDTIPPTPARP